MDIVLEISYTDVIQTLGLIATVVNAVCSVLALRKMKNNRHCCNNDGL